MAMLLQRARAMATLRDPQRPTKTVTTRIGADGTGRERGMMIDERIVGEARGIVVVEVSATDLGTVTDEIARETVTGLICVRFLVW